MSFIDISLPGKKLLFRDGIDYVPIRPLGDDGLKYILTREISVETGVTGHDVTLKDAHLTTAEGAVARLYKNGLLVIYAGAKWDGPSGAPDTVATMLSSLVHDIFYYMMRGGYLPWDGVKNLADHLLQAILWNAMIARYPELRTARWWMKAVPKWAWSIFAYARSGWYYAATRTFGGLGGEGGR